MAALQFNNNHRLAPAGGVTELSCRLDLKKRMRASASFEAPSRRKRLRERDTYDAKTSH